MKRRILLVVSVLLMLAGMFILLRVAADTLVPKGKGALQVTSNLKSDVILNNKVLGQTPLCKCDQNETIQAGVYELKIIPEDKNMQPFMTRVRINPGVLTAVERTFLPGAYASSYILTLEETNSRDPEIFIASIPDGALVSINGKEEGITPLFLKSISASEHEIEMQKQGFSKKTVRVRAVPSYKLVLNVILGTETGTDETAESAPTPTPTPTQADKPSVIIKNTPVGFLRVRENPSTASREIGRVSPGERFPYLDENTDWFQIELAGGVAGWISKQYASREE
jgi:hypothetical protein